MKVKSESEVAQLCPTLSNPMDCSLPGSSVLGIFQAGVLEWGAIAFSTFRYDLNQIPFAPGLPFLHKRETAIFSLHCGTEIKHQGPLRGSVLSLSWFKGPLWDIGRRQWHPTPVLLPGKSHGQRSLVGRSPWGREESDMTERLH